MTLVQQMTLLFGDPLPQPEPDQSVLDIAQPWHWLEGDGRVTFWFPPEPGDWYQVRFGEDPLPVVNVALAGIYRENKMWVEMWDSLMLLRYKSISVAITARRPLEEAVKIARVASE